MKLKYLVVATLLMFSSPAVATTCWDESRDSFASRSFEGHNAASVYDEKQ